MGKTWYKSCKLDFYHLERPGEKQNIYFFSEISSWVVRRNLFLFICLHFELLWTRNYFPLPVGSYVFVHIYVSLVKTDFSNALIDTDNVQYLFSICGYVDFKFMSTNTFHVFPLFRGIKDTIGWYSKEIFTHFILREIVGRCILSGKAIFTYMCTTINFFFQCVNNIIFLFA